MLVVMVATDVATYQMIQHVMAEVVVVVVLVLVLVDIMQVDLVVPIMTVILGAEIW